MLGFKKYQAGMAEYAYEYLMRNKDKLVQNEMKNHKVEKTLYTKVFEGFTEISNTLDALRMSEMLISLSPPRSKKINKEEYNIYIIGTYLHDLYILHKRLKTYATRIERIYSQTSKRDLLDKHVKPLHNIVDSRFKGFTDIRSEHVHVGRYFDYETEMSSSFSLISRDYPDYEREYRMSYENARNVWKGRIKTINDAIEKIVDYYFAAIHVVIFEDGRFFVPDKVNMMDKR